MTLTRVSQDTIQSFRDGTGSNHSDSDRIFHAGRRWRDETTAVAMKRPFLANNGLRGHVPGTSALPLTADNLDKAGNVSS